MLFYQFILHNGFYTMINSDQGPDSTSKIIKKSYVASPTSVLISPRQLPTIPWEVECASASIELLSNMLSPEEKKDWKIYIAPSVYTCNCIRHDNIGQTPHSHAWEGVSEY
jgi:hypothetical protein